MSQPVKSVDTVTLGDDRPTELTFADLYRWVIWQFPRYKGDRFCGAAHPPAAETGWYPAVILAKQQCVLVHAHLGQTFDSPEAAMAWLINDES
jgi:hypothetical protein